MTQAPGKPYYVALTGGKNNAGDFLIKHRGAALFAAYRPDRALVDLDGWKPFDDATLALVNGAQALVLMGGPALQEHMAPNVYALVPDLDAIRVPIATMGIGWKAARGEWHDTYDYPLSPRTLALLERVRRSGLRSSVRDFHTWNVLSARGMDNYLMTGCPAYFDLDRIGRPVPAPAPPRRVAFSLGVSFVRSPAMEAQMKAQVLAVRGRFPDAAFEVVFHHALDPGVYAGVYGDAQPHNDRHVAFAQWLQAQGIAFRDISGAAAPLIAAYGDADLHVGYRVHAHIFMASQGKLSVLLAEDGRGRATRDVMGGLLVDGFAQVRTGRIARAMSRRLGIGDRFRPNPHATGEALRLVDYELASGGQRTATTRAMIDRHLPVMQAFLAQLP